MGTLFRAATLTNSFGLPSFKRMDTLFRAATVKIFWPPFQKEVYSFRVDRFSEGNWCAEKQTGSWKFSPLFKMVENPPSISNSLIIANSTGQVDSRRMNFLWYGSYISNNDTLLWLNVLLYNTLKDMLGSISHFKGSWYTLKGDNSDRTVLPPSEFVCIEVLWPSPPIWGHVKGSHG